MQGLLANSKLDSSVKDRALAEIESTNLKKKLVFSANDDQVEIAMNGKVRLTIKLVNPILESFLLNNYPASLLGKTDLERYIYLKKVIRASSVKPNSAAKNKMSILIPSAVAAEESRWLEDNDVIVLALATTVITDTAKKENCEELKANKKFKSSFTQALKNRMSGTVENFPFAELAAQVGVSFRCGNLKTQLAKPVTSFHVVCKDGETESMSYSSLESSGATVGYINKTKKTFGDTSAISIIEKRFGDGFADSVAKCCRITACASHINSIAPLSTTDSQNTHDKIKSKLAK